LAHKHLQLNQKRLEQLKFTLPKHRDLLNKLNSVGFSTL
jgi:tryptophan 7-halogenase